MTQTTLKNVTIVGGSGNLGSAILKALQEDGDFNVSVLTRDSSTATFPPGVKVYRTDYSEPSLVAAFKGEDAVISVVGQTGFAEQTKLVDAALKAGVKRFLPSEFSVNTLAPGVLELLPVFKIKVDLLDYLKSKEKDGLSWTGIAIGPLSDWGLQIGLLGFDLATKEATIWDSGDIRFSATSVKGLGDAVIGALRKEKETANKYFYVASLTTTQNEILDCLQKATETQWTIKTTTTEEMIQTGRSSLAKGDMNGAFPLLQATLSAVSLSVKADFERDETLSSELLGVVPETALENVERVLSGKPL